MVSRNAILAGLIVVVALGVLYMLDPTLFGLLRREGFEDVTVGTGPGSSTGEGAGQNDVAGRSQRAAVMGNPNVAGAQDNTSPMMPKPEGFENYEMNNGMEATEGFENLSPETMPFPAANKPSNCYPKNQLAPQELLPGDPNSKWAQVNPQATGDIAGKNFLNAGALIGVNTVGQSNRNANWDIRAAPPNPQVEVSPWLQSTIGPDLSRRPLDIA
jgi:hypothetical protein